MPAKYRNPREQWHRIGFTTDSELAHKKALEFAQKFDKVTVKKSVKHGKKGFTVWHYGA